jgi:DNA replication protein DnaC
MMMASILQKPVELEEQEFHCSKHGPYHGKPTKFGSSLFEPECPECHAEAKAKEAQRLIEKAEFERQAWLRRMNIGKKFWNEDFESFNAHSPALKKYLDACTTFAQNPDGKTIVMMGANGNGKTHLATSILKKTGGAIYTSFEIGLRLHAAMSGIENENLILAELCTLPLLVIDEIEKAKDTEYKHNWMSYVVGKRYDNMLPLIIIGNCHYEKDCPSGHCSHCLEHNLESDVISRIFEDGVIMEFNERDYRSIKRMNKTEELR